MSDLLFICDVEGCATSEGIDLDSWQITDFSPGNEIVSMTCDQHG